MTFFSRVYDLLFESKLHLRLIKTWTRLKLFGSLQVVIRVMNDKLQEAEESNEELQEAGAMTIISMMIDDCPLEMIYDSLFGSRAVSIGRSQIETARRQSRRAGISRA